MSEFFLKENLIPSQQSDKVRKLARARTLTVLPRLDGSRKGSIIRFLYDADLINVDIEGSIMDLSGADLRGADLSMANLSHTFLEHADLKGATLGSANLSGAFLNKADLRAISKKEARLGNNSTLAHI